MPVYNYPGYISKERAAQIWKVQVRTINDWIRKTSPAPDNFSYITVDGYICIKSPLPDNPPPPNILLQTLVWVRNYADNNNMTSERIYEAIIQGRFSAVNLCDRVFIIKTETEFLQFVASYKRRKE